MPNSVKVAAICCTYKRPGQLEEAIEAFIRQDYPAECRELVILDDAGQYDSHALGEIPGVKLLSTDHRFRTLGEKRNASAALASPDVEVYCVWDDDDIYLPWHMSAAVNSLGNADYSIPSVVYIDKRTRIEAKRNGSFFHGAWSFRRSAFEAVCGYPFIQSGQDQGLLKRFRSQRLRQADPIESEPRPSYIYRWFTAHSMHISAMGKDGYERMGRESASQIARLLPGWTRDWVQLHEQAKSSAR